MIKGKKKAPQKRSSKTTTVKKASTKVKEKDPALIPEVVQEPEYSLTDISQLPPKQQAFVLLKENNITTKEAAQMLGYNHSYARQIAPKIAKYSLTNKKMVKSAHVAVKNILEGKPWGSIDKVKDSSALAAAGMVYDRLEPVKRSDSETTNISFTQINLDLSNRKNDV